MGVAYVLWLSVFFQFLAVYLALRLIPVTGWRKAWILISSAIFLMAVRRCFSLFLSDSSRMSVLTDPAVTEWIGLATSILMVAGIAMISPLFLSIKRSAETLRESETCYRTLFESAQDAIFLMNKGGISMECNPAAQRFFRCSEEEIIGKNLFDFSPERQPEDKSSKMESENLIRLVFERGSLRFEWVFETNGGELLDTEVSLNKIPMNGSVKMIAVVRDIREQKQAQQMLRKEREHLAAVLDGSPIPSFMVNCQGEVILWNRACEGFTLMRREDIVGKPMDLTPLFGGKSLPVLADLVLNRSEEEILKRYAEKGLRRYEPLSEAFESKGYIIVEGQKKSIRIIAARVKDSGGNLIGVIQCAEDITREEELQKQFLHAQKMEAVGRLAGGIAHDFNNILTVIMGYADLLLMCLAHDEQLLQKVGEIKKAGERASSLTHQLLAFSRKQILQPKVLNLNTVISNMEEMVRRLIGEDIFLFTVLDPEVGSVRIDPGQLEQVIMNLAVNARDAMSQGGRLTIETANVELDETYARQHVGVRPGRYVMLAVSDTGIGMDPETQAHIFEPFFTTKDMHKGTGLGLATVYGIIQQSQGHIWVYSEPSKGTTFKIYLPRISEDAIDFESVSSLTESPHGTETILLVEDDETVRAIVSESLRMNGYTVLESGNGKDAFRISGQYNAPIHLLISDIVMPGTDGCELAKQLTVSRPNMKVLFISGYTDRSIVHNGILEHGTAFLQKPFSLEVLARKIREILIREG